MMRLATMRRRFTLWAIIFAVWTAIGVFFAIQVYFDSLLRSRQIPLSKALVWQLTATFALALATPPVLWLARRFRIERHNWQSRLAIHILAAITFAFILTYIHVVNDLFHARGLEEVSLARVARFTFAMLDKDILVYCAIVLISHAFDYHSRYQSGLVRAAQLETRLAHAQLQALKMQLNPHFLFNTLNAIAELIHRTPDAADEMITRLSDMLRATLDNIGVQEVSLKQELEFLERYLAIERIRMGSRLQFSMSVAPDALDARVPNMILQPLVENAVQYALAPRAKGGSIRIAATRDTNGKLNLDVSDDGRGLDDEVKYKLQNVELNAALNVNKLDGVGLANTRARLAHLYGSAANMELSPVVPHGLSVRLTLPFRDAVLENHEDKDSDC